jgi:PhnB protein
MKYPAHYNRLMPYMILPDATKFIPFMKSVFGATEGIIIPRSEGLIMHGEMQIGDSTIMFADTTPEYGPRPAGIYIYVENVDDTYRKAISLGAQSLRVPEQQPYGYTCGFHDPFGNDWWPVQAERE